MTDPSKTVLYLRRGTRAQIEKITPHYDGELVLCTDQPLLYVGLNGAYVPMPIPECAREGFNKLYDGSSATNLDWPA
ncbi:MULTISPECIES: hypothetical protein [unclassified Pseudomonas]|uniref:hypothetical protein n=1 Tax=unclassified Pseudomonas TaxID=196821 RepID=UPI00115FFA1B|nr:MULTISPECIES: hypothetical protein [unclassified Pseudomonas]